MFQGDLEEVERALEGGVWVEGVREVKGEVVVCPKKGRGWCDGV